MIKVKLKFPEMVFSKYSCGKNTSEPVKSYRGLEEDGLQ